jgi:DNA-binding CsgD family transcriptional regulator
MRARQWKTIGTYGLALAIGALALQWLDYDRLAHARPGDIYLVLVAVAFLALGLFLGTKLLGTPQAKPFDGNPQAVNALGISPRELAVLQELADGHSNKVIARHLDVSPNTVKTHLARLYEKLGAERRTDAVKRARELGIIA